MSKDHREYYSHMDGLRTLAITLVMIEHFGGLLPTHFTAGGYGVQLFFVISGFLITSILLKSKGEFGQSVRTFMGRRALRIFPVYYLALLVLYTVDFGNTREDILWLGSYTWNYVCTSREGENWLFYLWSLSVEEQFYLVWPFLVLSIRSKPVALALLTLTITVLGFAQTLFNVIPFLVPYPRSLVHSMGYLGLGALGAIAFTYDRVPRWVLTQRWFEVLIYTMLVWTCISDSKYRFPVMGVGALVLVLKSVHGDYAFASIRRALSHPVSIFVGRISYGIYVYHWPFGIGLNQYVFDPIWLSIDFEALGPLAKLRWHSWIVKLPLYYAATIGLAYLSFRYFEQPLLRLKDRWFPTSGSVPSAPAET